MAYVRHYARRLYVLMPVITGLSFVLFYIFSAQWSSTFQQVNSEQGQAEGVGPDDVTLSPSAFKSFLHDVRRESGELSSAPKSNANQKHGVLVKPIIECQTRHTFLIYVLSSPVYFEKRHMVRATWGDLSPYSNFKEHGFNVQIMFVMGIRSVPLEFAERLRGEIETHHDIWIGDFVDSYDNVTTKGIRVIQWVWDYCDITSLDFLMKIDDDVLPNMFGLLQKAWAVAQKEDSAQWPHFIGHVAKEKEVIRDAAEWGPKWVVTPEEYPEARYPYYCIGPLYIITKAGLPFVLEGLKKTKIFRMEDVYLTSLAPRSVSEGGELRYKMLSHKTVLTMLSRVQKLFSLDTVHNLDYAHELPLEYWTEAQQMLTEHYLH